MAGFGVWLRGLLGKQKPIPRSSSPQARKRSNNVQSFAEDNNAFALEMYGQLRQRHGNLFFSPLSIRTVLGITLAGARGETAAEMKEALCISSSDETLHVDAAEAIRQFNRVGRGDYEITVANSLWGQEGEPLQPGFVDLIARYYRGAMNLADFRRGAEAAGVTINKWVEDKTRQKILELIPSGLLDADTRLVLVNAVYFRGVWVLQFPKSATREEPFHLEGGGKVRAPLMHQQEQTGYVQAAAYQAVDLNYQGADLSMLVLLPDKKDGLLDLEARLSVRMLHDCVAKMRVRDVELFLPRFSMTWGTINLAAALRALGISLAFSPSQADFSGINGQEPPHEESLFLSAVLHKAFVDVNEEGTEAAAATAIAMAPTAASPTSTPPPIPIFRADHPFLFAIRERKSGAILFLGRMTDPTGES